MITLAEAKKQLNIPASNTTHDVELQVFVDASAGAVERHTGRAGAVRTVIGERHQTGFTAKLWLFHPPVRSVTSVTRIDGSLTWDVLNLDVDIDSGVLRVITGPLFSGLLQVTYEAGHVEVPPRFNLAARIIVQHLWETQRGNARPFLGGVVGEQETYDPQFSFAIPRRALELLGPPVPTLA